MKPYQYDPRAYKTWHKIIIYTRDYQHEKDIMKWLRTNMGGRYKTISQKWLSYHTCRLAYFEKEEDLVLFNMRWL